MPPIPSEILRQVKGIAIRTRGLVDTILTGEYRSVFRGQGMEFAEVRGYQPGDDYRTIDWNVSARLGAPYVKTFTEEREVTLFLVFDRSGVNVLLANYGSGSVAAFRLAKDGRLVEPSAGFVQHRGSSVDPKRYPSLKIWLKKGLTPGST